MDPRLELGLGAAEALAVPGPGVVLSRHRTGAWLRLPGGICGLAAPEALPGPLWARGRFAGGHLESGMPAVVTPAALEVGGLRFPLACREGMSPSGVPQSCSARLRNARPLVWRGALPPPHLVEAAPARRLAVEALSTARPSAVLQPSLAGAARRAATAVAAGDLLGAAAALGGLGPGLTPAGDDVLAGLLLAARARFGPPAEPALRAVAASVTTTDLSGACLRWAARGQHVGPAHDLFVAAARGDRSGAGAAVRALRSFGSSSGVDLAFGLRLGLGELPPGGERDVCRNLAEWAGMSGKLANSQDTGARRVR